MKCACVAFVALAVFLGTCQATEYMFTAKYEMRNQNSFPDSYVLGEVTYYLDDVTLKNSRILYDTSYNGFSNPELYHYEKKAIYNLCPENCKSASLNIDPEEWWKTDKITAFECAQQGGYWKCSVDTSKSLAVAEFVTRGKPGDQNFDIKYVSFSDGRNLTFYDGIKVISSASEKERIKKNVLVIPNGMECEEPACRSYMDIVFVLDESSSIEKDVHGGWGRGGWAKSISFVQAVSKEFVTTDGTAKFGVVTFSGPQRCCCSECFNNGQLTNRKSCCSNWLNLLCDKSRLSYTQADNGEDRFLDDCLFDEKCRIEYEIDNTSRVLTGLTSDIYNQAATWTNPSCGHTCQRYGLIQAYNMIYGSGNSRREQAKLAGTPPPIPVVIVVTDGWDLCAKSTKEWAEKIKNEDDRAILLEIGVGLYDDYDKRYLADLSSKLDGQPVYLNVDDYADLPGIVDRLKVGVCDNVPVSSPCGAGCKGFCACGECVCPICSKEDAPACKEFTCHDDGGCVSHDVVCEQDTTRCYESKCHTDVSQCKTTPLDCKAILKNRGVKFANCQRAVCSNGTIGSDGKTGCKVENDNGFCKQKAGNCIKKSTCNPSSPLADSDGCVHEPENCDDEKWKDCTGVHCFNGECTADNCGGPCYEKDPDSGKFVERCREKRPCQDVECIYDGDQFIKCNYTPKVCAEEVTNLCKVVFCDEDLDDCTSRDVDGGCPGMNTFCTFYSCDESANEGRGGCVPTNKTHEEDNCYDYVCSDEKEQWIAIPRCTTDLACKIARCNYEDGSCYEEDLDCYSKVTITDSCFQAACREPTGCYKRQYRGAYFDVCGNCINGEEGSGSVEAATDCVTAPDEELKTEGLAAAAIALIIVGAIIIGAAIMFSGIMGTKALIDRARGAANQSVVSNPLFEDSQTEMSNPGFLGETI